MTEIEKEMAKARDEILTAKPGTTHYSDLIRHYDKLKRKWRQTAKCGMKS